MSKNHFPIVIGDSEPCIFVRSHRKSLGRLIAFRAPRDSNSRADFTYVRWLGDRKGIEERTKVWNEVIIDRHAELSEWADVLGKVHKRKIQIYAFANNHFAGYAPATAEMFQQLWRRQMATEIGKPSRAMEQGQLFK